MTYTIYRILREESLSGDIIGKRLSISRTAVNKHIAKLRERGVDIKSLKGVGYRWIGDVVVNEYSLMYELEGLGINIPVICKDCESTNKEAKKIALENDNNILIVAPCQSKGKGRSKRDFESLLGGAYFSLIISNVELDLANIMRAVIASGVAVYDILKVFGVSSLLKWPNDVYVNNKKICGILMELITNGEYADKIIIGIGINIDNELSSNLLDTATRLKENTKSNYNVSQIIAMIVDRLLYYVELLKSGDWPIIRNKYINNSYTLQKQVCYNEKKGIAKGIDNQGFLIINSNGEEQKILSGDVDIC